LIVLGERGRMQTKEDVLEQVQAALVELFEIEPGRITPEARLNEDLEIDSIDAVDLLDRLRRQTGRKISADDFRTVRTVGDLVNAVHTLVQA
jgi:acyl carrier protein